MHAIILNGGPPPHPGVRQALPGPIDLVIAADSGLDHAAAIGHPVDLLVGDLDSVSAESLARARAAGLPIERHRPDKDATDLELSLAAAVVRGATKVTVVGGIVADRLDHLFAAIAMLGAPQWDAIEVDAFIGPAWLTIVRAGQCREIRGDAGEVVSIVPIGGAVNGVTLAGLRYPLVNASLTAGTTLGVSNEFIGSPAAVSISTGTVVVIQPFSLKDL